MSNIRTLYTNISNMDVSFTREDSIDTGVITCRDLNELPDGVVGTAELPVRLLLPMEEWGGDAPNLGIISAGATGVTGMMTWMVVDLLLWDQVGQNVQLQQHYPDLVRYCGAHIEQLLDNKDMADHVYLRNVTYRTGVYSYPMGSTKQYYGVEATISFEEVVNP
jgi:hypothetical protein